MKDLIRSAQASIAEQISTALPTNDSVLKRMMAATVLTVAAVTAAVAPGQANAQMSSEDASILNGGTSRVGQTVGYEIGRRDGMGGEAARVVGTAAESVGRVVTGQDINGVNVGRVIGGALGAIFGNKVAGNDRTAKTVGTVVGGVAGVIGGGAVGRMIEEAGSSAPAMPQPGQQVVVPVNQADQADFLRSVREASQVRPAQPRQNVMPHNGQTAMVQPEHAGMSGVIANVMRNTRLPLVASGTQQPSDQAFLSLSNKAMELIKVGEGYRQSIDRWDNAFMTSQTPMVKQDINKQVQVSAKLLEMKALEYAQVRNAVASRGYDVSPVDGAIANRLNDLRPQTNYNFNPNQPGNNQAYVVR